MIWACAVAASGRAAESQGGARTAAPVGDCATGWLTRDGVAVDVHVRLSTGAARPTQWTTYADQPVLLVWDAIAA